MIGGRGYGSSRVEDEHILGMGERKNIEQKRRKYVKSRNLFTTIFRQEKNLVSEDSGSKTRQNFEESKKRCGKKKGKVQTCILLHVCQRS